MAQERELVLLKRENRMLREKLEEAESEVALLRVEVSSYEEILEQALAGRWAGGQEEEDGNPVVAVVRPWQVTGACERGPEATASADTTASADATHSADSTVSVAGPSSQPEAGGSVGAAVFGGCLGFIAGALFSGNLSFSTLKEAPSEAVCYFAAHNQHVDWIPQLLSFGADLSYKDENQMTALHHAAANGHVHIVTQLIDAGSPLDERDNTISSPLHHAARNGFTQCVEALIAAGVRVNVKDADGNTPLHLAAIINRYKCVSSLLTAGAKPFIRNKKREKPFDVAFDRRIRIILHC